MRSFFLFIASLALVGACGAGATPAPAAGAPPSFVPGVAPAPALLCQLLTPADWAANGLTGAGQPNPYSDVPGEAYCTYTAQAGVDGGLEFDAFTGEGLADAMETYQVLLEGMGTPSDVSVANCDDCALDPNVNGTFGAIMARGGQFAFTISLPTSAQAEAQLKALAALVLQRATALR
jgi:hypothetical protein